MRDGRERRRQVDAAQAGRRRDRSPTRARVTVGAQREDGLLRAARDGAARRRTQTVWDSLQSRSFPRLRSARCARWRASSASRATTSTSPVASCPAARRRAWCLRRCSTIRRISWSSTSRPTISTWPPRTCWSRRSPTSRARCSSSRTIARFSRPVQPRARVTPRGPHLYGGGYTEYVAQTGHEAPGIRSQRFTNVPGSRSLTTPGNRSTLLCIAT